MQVLAKALEVWDLPLEPLDAPHMIQSAHHPEQENAFICNLQVSRMHAFQPLSYSYCPSGKARRRC